eukprot:m.75371 g.75371  ORF g.75371 m.75371 type:complete len:1000 (-) comp14478_c1_seq4:140-3139(-)
MSGHAGKDERAPPVAILFISFSLLLGVLLRGLVAKLPIRIPYTVGLFVTGVIWGVVNNTGKIGSLGVSMGIAESMDPHLFMHIFLPLLIFESAFSLNWHVFRRQLPQIMLLAVFGVVISSMVTGAMVKAVVEVDWSWSECFMLGAILSATDPVAVVALLRDLGVSTKISTLIEGESLLNDGTAIVLFTVFFDLAEGAQADGGKITGMFLQLSLGGVAMGIAWALATIWWLGHIMRDPLMEITIVFASSYLLFWVSERCKVSGVLAIVTMGASFAWFGKTRITPDVMHSMQVFLSTLSYHADTLVFLIAGIIIEDHVGFSNLTGSQWGMMFALYAIVTLVRMLMVAILSPALVRTGYGFDWRRAAVLVHGGLRGAVALALALIVELDTNIDKDVRKGVLFYTSGIALLTLIVNASTTHLLLNAVGLTRTNQAEADGFVHNVKELESHVTEIISELAKRPEMAHCNWVQIERFVRSDTAKLAKGLGLNPSSETPTASEANTHGVVVQLKRTTYDEERLQQARLRFLRGLRGVYRHMFHNGILERSALAALIEAADTAEDNSKEPLNQWSQTLQKIARNPPWLSWLARNYPSTPFVHTLLFNHTAFAVNVADGFVLGLKDMVRHSIEETDPQHVVQLAAECETDRGCARAFVEKVARKYSAALVQIRSKQAAHLLLTKQRGLLTSFAHGGRFLDREIEHLEQMLDKKQLKLVLNKQRFSNATFDDALRVGALFGQIPDQLFDKVVAIRTAASWPAGSVVLSEALPVEGVLFIHSGTIVYCTRDGTEEHLRQGMCLGVAEMMARSPGLVTMWAKTDVECAFFPAKRLRSWVFAQGAEKLMDNVVTLAAMHYAFLERQRVFSAGGQVQQFSEIAEAPVAVPREMRDVIKAGQWERFDAGARLRVSVLGLLLAGSVAGPESGKPVPEDTVEAPTVLPAGSYVATGPDTIVHFLQAHQMEESGGRSSPRGTTRSHRAASFTMQASNDEPVVLLENPLVAVVAESET